MRAILFFPLFKKRSSPVAPSDIYFQTSCTLASTTRVQKKGILILLVLRTVDRKVFVDVVISLPTWAAWDAGFVCLCGHVG